ncbi:hypothetical protein PRIPAC_70183 [Pristionchus pacificus]|uniref:Methionine--tRNA ligase, mitochondrial n=1 Tax=Pristionchus pacificus TaxID=54126 RepID=A0A2A6CFQ6_PRIPA|nr:hypothetical protein PRIPAC_70183 [Pristionchus pacificus]|eukprot:PDM77042.1 tRNA synthetase [Pristionchus pacificus]
MRISYLRQASSFITTPIFYANGPPHLGHLYTAIIGDSAHRWNRLKDPQSEHFFATGTDEHGSKIAKTAKEKGLTSIELCDQVSASFRHLFREFDINTSDYIRTTEKRHRECVEVMWKRLEAANCIEKSAYSGWYSTTDECFYQEGDVEDGPDGKISKETRSRVEWHEEENYMFKLDQFHEKIRTWMTKNDVIRPKHYLPNALRYIEAESRLSISRDASRLLWGIPVPGDSSQTIYVWLDALCNYLTVRGYPDCMAAPAWPPTTQIIGKDILKFHAVYWPAFLLAAGLDLPQRLFVHGHWLVDGSKMSKSVGNVIEPLKMSELLSKEGLRYFLLKQGLPHDDSNFAVVKAINVINADLVNNVANLVSRACATKINEDQVYPYVDVLELHDEICGSANPLIAEMNALKEKVIPLYDNILFYKAIEEIMAVSKLTNAFFQVHAPWKMSKGAKLSTVLYVTYEATRIISLLMQPITPKLSDFCLSRLGISSDYRNLETATFGGGPKMDQVGRPLGEDKGLYMDRIEVPKEKVEPRKANKEKKKKANKVE